MSDEDRLQAWFDFLGDTYTRESFDEAMGKFDRGEAPPRTTPGAGTKQGEKSDGR